MKKSSEICKDIFCADVNSDRNPVMGLMLKIKLKRAP